PAMRIVVGGRAKDFQAASTSEMARFETETLSTQENLKHLMDLSGKWTDQAHQHRKLTKLILDRGAPCGRSSADEQRSSVLCGGPGRDGAGGSHAFLGRKSLQPLLCSGSLTCWRCNPGSRARSSGKDRIVKGD